MGQKIAVVAFCVCEGDDRAAMRVKDRCADLDVEIITYNGDIDEVTRLFNRASMVIASRFHSMIMGFVYNRPVFPIAYNCKTKHYLDDLNYDQTYADLKTLEKTEVDDVLSCYRKEPWECSWHKENAVLQFEALKRYLS